MNIDMLILRGIRKRQYTPVVDPGLGKHFDAGDLGSNGGTIGSKAQMSLCACDYGRLFGVIGMLRPLLSGKPDSSRKDEMKNQNHENLVSKHNYFYNNSGDTAHISCKHSGK